jgi:hypothetical protein
LRFDAVVFLGVHWSRVLLLREADMEGIPLRGELDRGLNTVRFEADLERLEADETLVLHTQEDVSVVPPVPLALTVPRRGFAARNWRLE